jgi:hypothetical protein
LYLRFGAEMTDRIESRYSSIRRALAAREEMLLIAVCVLLALGCVATTVWMLLSGAAARQGLDALFVILFCLLVAGAFMIVPLAALARSPMFARVKSRLRRTKVAKSESNVAAASAGAEERT